MAENMLKQRVAAMLEKAKDEKTRARVKAEVLARLKQGKAAILKLQQEINKPENRARAAAQLQRAKVALVHLKKEAKRRERQAVSYTKKNPEKALILAVAAGAAAGALLLALKPKARA